MALFFLGGIAGHAEEPFKGQEEAVLTSPPLVPPPITRKYRTKMIVHLEVMERVGELAPGVQYNFWTFGGTVPGKFIRVREGDVVEMHLSNNPANKMPHNIDMHAVIGQGGGASSSITAPGHSSTFSFTALHPGLFVYHCATAPVGMHIANGMYGLILVQPKNGLPPVGREYYVMQSEFYTKGPYGQEGLQGFDMNKAIHEQPEYVVFNGAVGALTGDKALTAKVGEKVRFYVGNIGPNFVSSFHVIGEIFDKVYREAGFKSIEENVQTTLIPAGGATVVELKMAEPGTFLLVDHSIFRAFNQGCLGMVKVTGPENKEIYSGKISDDVYRPEGATIQSIGAAPTPPHGIWDKAALMERGQHVFEQVCAACHQPDAQGVPTAFPPLAKSDFLMANKKRAVDIVMNGHSGEITVNGMKFNGVMPKLELDDASIAAALTYVRNSFGNAAGDSVSVDEVKAERAAQK